MNLFFYLAHRPRRPRQERRHRVHRPDRRRGHAHPHHGATRSPSRSRSPACAPRPAWRSTTNRSASLFILLASAMWAAYIVVGTRVAASGPRARRARRRPGDRRGRARAVRRAGSGDGVRLAAAARLCCLVGLLAIAIGYGIDQHVMRRIPPASVRAAARAAPRDAVRRRRSSPSTNASRRALDMRRHRPRAGRRRSTSSATIAADVGLRAAAVMPRLAATAGLRSFHTNPS